MTLPSLDRIFFDKSNEIEKYNIYGEEINNHLNNILGIPQNNSKLLPLLTVNLDKIDNERNKCLNKLNNDIRSLIFPGVSISYSPYGGKYTFPHIINEMIMNIKQHSRAKKVYIYSQRYQDANCIDVGILNDGITIPKKYEQAKDSFHNEYGLNPYEVENDCEAIYKAINGISTKELFKNSRCVKLARSVDDILNCAETSCGIKSSIRLITEGLDSSFLIASREGACYLTKEKTKFIKAEQNPIVGTFVWMRFKRKYLNKAEYEKIINNHGPIMMKKENIN